MKLQELVVKISADTRDAAKKIDNLRERTKKMQEGFSKAGTGMMVAGGAIAAGLGLAIKNAAGEEVAQTKLATAMKATNQYSDKQFHSLVKLAGQLQDTTGVGDETIQETMAFGMQMGLTAEQTKKLIPHILDLNAATGVDLKTAMRAAAEAAHGTVGMIQRYGITVKKSEDGTVDFNNLIQSFSGYAGTAKAKGETFTGQLDIMKAEFSDLSKEIGFVLIPILKDFLDKYIKPLIDKFEALSPKTKENIAKFGALAAAILLVGGAAMKLISGIMGITSVIMKSMSAISVLVATNPVLAMIAGIAAAVVLLVIAWKKDFGGIQEKTEAVGKVLHKVFAGIVAGFHWVIREVKKVIDWFERMFDKIKKAFDEAKDFFRLHSSNINPTQSSINLANQIGPGIPGHAAGGFFTKPHIAMIAEHGPEQIRTQSEIMQTDNLLKSILRELKKLNEAVPQSSREFARAVNGMAK